MIHAEAERNVKAQLNQKATRPKKTSNNINLDDMI